MGARSIMGTYGGAIARAKTFSLTQVKFQWTKVQILRDAKIDENTETKRLKTVSKRCYTKRQAFSHFFAFLFQYFLSFSFSSSALACPQTIP